jgi:hypothetical protein
VFPEGQSLRVRLDEADQLGFGSGNDAHLLGGDPHHGRDCNKKYQSLKLLKVIEFLHFSIISIYLTVIKKKNLPV